MININELSLLQDFKYLHLSDKICKGEANLDGKWIRFYDRSSYQVVDFDDYILKVGSSVYGDDNIIFQKDGTIFINEKSKDLFKTNGDIVGYLFDIENRWRMIKKEGNKHMPFKSWRNDLYGLILFVMFCILTLIGGTMGLLTGLLSSVIVGGIIGVLGYFVLSSKIKRYVSEYIHNHEYDDYSKILIQEYMTE